MPTHTTRSGSDGIWIALPTYNERDNLEPMLDRLLGAVPSASILVVDDNSPDGTGALADELARREPRIRVLHRPGKQGLGAAYRAAFAQLLERPDCWIVVQMDCDFSHDPADVARLVGAVAAGADLAIGSRYVPGGATPGWGIGRRLISRGGSGFARTLLHLGVHDLTGGFKAWRADLLRSMDLGTVQAHGYGFQIEMTWRAHQRGARIRELPITFSERRAGSSKMSRRIVLEALLLVLRLRADALRPMRRRRSAGLLLGRVRELRLVRRADGIAVDQLGAVAVTGLDGPADGGLTAHDAREAELTR